MKARPRDGASIAAEATADVVEAKGTALAAANEHGAGCAMVHDAAAALPMDGDGLFAAIAG